MNARHILCATAVATFAVVGLPDGGVVRLDANDQNGATTITLLSLDAGPFADDPFTPPAGYEKTQMPNLPE